MIYIYIYIYLYISAGPSFEGPPGCGGYVANWQSQVPPVFHCIWQFASLVSAFSCLQVSSLVFGNCLLDPPSNEITTTTRVCCLNLGPPRVPLKNHHISSLPPGPLKIRKSAPRVTKRHQNVSQIPHFGDFLVTFWSSSGKQPTCDPLEPARSDCMLGGSGEVQFHHFLINMLGSQL